MELGIRKHEGTVSNFRATILSFYLLNFVGVLKDLIHIHRKKRKIVVLCSRPPQNVRLESALTATK